MNALQLPLLAHDRIADLRRETTRRDRIATPPPSPVPPRGQPVRRLGLRLLAAPFVAVRRHTLWAAGR